MPTVVGVIPLVSTYGRDCIVCGCYNYPCCIVLLIWLLIDVVRIALYCLTLFLLTCWRHWWNCVRHYRLFTVIVIVRYLLLITFFSGVLTCANLTLLITRAVIAHLRCPRCYLQRFMTLHFTLFHYIVDCATLLWRRVLYDPVTAQQLVTDAYDAIVMVSWVLFIPWWRVANLMPAIQPDTIVILWIIVDGHFVDVYY